MIRGLYTAAAGMIAEQRRHDTVTNNVANLNTPGYKGVNSVNRAFPEMLISLMGSPDDTKGTIGKLNTGVFAEESLINLGQGDLNETGRSQDLALVSDILVNGQAFDGSGKYVDANGNVSYQPQALFTVQNANGERRYTRDGGFRATADGMVVTSDGMRVLGTNGQPIRVEGSWDHVQVTADGRLINKETQQPLAGNPAFLLTEVSDPNQLVREGDGKYRYAGDANGLRQVQPGERVEIKQGYLERSNVDASQSMVDMMSALRAYEANQKMVQYYDRSLDRAVNDVGRI
ncbi:flagellar hook-basal body protein [Cohnella sp. 56]|uniref:flagellar hook-basal body protein n=1 Tax=Cohnella sp. 56 TaxID=3113722 RepID=UPI0030E82987